MLYYEHSNLTDLHDIILDRVKIKNKFLFKLAQVQKLQFGSCDE